jgi:hypothetical protein
LIQVKACAVPFGHKRCCRRSSAAKDATAMLTLEDCIALSELTKEEVEAIAEDKHLPEVIAAELGNYLLHFPDGVKRIKAIIRHDIDEARSRGNLRHAAKLKLVLQHFIIEHATPGRLSIGLRE